MSRCRCKECKEFSIQCECKACEDNYSCRQKEQCVFSSLDETEALNLLKTIDFDRFIKAFTGDNNFLPEK